MSDVEAYATPTIASITTSPSMISMSIPFCDIVGVTFGGPRALQRREGLVGPGSETSIGCVRNRGVSALSVLERWQSGQTHPP